MLDVLLLLSVSRGLCDTSQFGSIDFGSAWCSAATIGSATPTCTLSPALYTTHSTETQPRPTLERLDDQRRGRWDDRDGSLSVLDGELDGNSQTLPVAGSLGNVFSDLLWRLREGLDTFFPSRRVLAHQTERTDLWGESRRGTDLTTSGSEVDDLWRVRGQLILCLTEVM